MTQKTEQRPLSKNMFLKQKIIRNSQIDCLPDPVLRDASFERISSFLLLTKERSRETQIEHFHMQDEEEEDGGESTGESQNKMKPHMHNGL